MLNLWRRHWVGIVFGVLASLAVVHSCYRTNTCQCAQMGHAR